MSENNNDYSEQTVAPHTVVSNVASNNSPHFQTSIKSDTPTDPENVNSAKSSLFKDNMIAAITLTLKNMFTQQQNATPNKVPVLNMSLVAPIFFCQI